MSHKGTLPVVSDRTAFENCLAAVEKCDLFLGLITPQYGSGRDRKRPELPSITHSEIKLAIKLKKPRWILAHDHVVFAWSLLKNITHPGGSGRKGLTLKKSQILDDLRAWTSTKKRLATKRIYLIASATGCKSFARLTMAHCLSVLSSIVIRRWKTSFVRTLRADHLSILREVKHDKRRHSKTVGAGRRTTN